MMRYKIFQTIAANNIGGNKKMEILVLMPILRRVMPGTALYKSKGFLDTNLFIRLTEGGKEIYQESGPEGRSLSECF